MACLAPILVAGALSTINTLFTLSQFIWFVADAFMEMIFIWYASEELFCIACIGSFSILVNALDALIIDFVIEAL